MDFPDETLRALADDAFTVLNWARRMGLKRERQIDEVVAAFRKTLADPQPAPANAPGQPVGAA